MTEEKKTPKQDKSATGQEKEKSSDEKEEKSTKKEKQIKTPEKFKDLVSQIEKLSVLDLAELVKVLENKFGVSAAPIGAGAPAAVGAAGADQEGTVGEKSSFDLELKESGDQKIAVIKVVKEITGQGLKEAKDLVDGAPKVIKQGLKKEEAEELKKKLEEAGAVVELK